MSSDQQKISRTDTITFPPFYQARGAMKVAIAPTLHDDPLEPNQAVPFRPQFSEIGIQPTFGIQVDVEKAVSDFGLSKSDLGVAAFFRDFAAKRYKVLSSWPINEVPSSWECQNPIRISSRVEIGVSLYLKKERKFELNKPHRTGLLLEKASIEIIPDWAVNFKTETVDAPPVDVIDILVNEKCADILERSDARTIAECLTSQIYSAIARGTLDRTKLPPKDSEGLLAKIHKQMKSTYEIDDPTLLLRASSSKDTLVECVVQSLMDLQKKLQSRK